MARIKSPWSLQMRFRSLGREKALAQSVFWPPWPLAFPEHLTGLGVEQAHFAVGADAVDAAVLKERRGHQECNPSGFSGSLLLPFHKTGTAGLSAANLSIMGP